MDSNLKIIQRLLEIGKNKMEYSVYPKPFKKEYIFIANALNYAVRHYENEFAELFKVCVGNYKSNLKKNRKYGWFHQPESLVYINMQINQLKYIIYGERHTNGIKFNEELGDLAYKDLINQIDPTILMTKKELAKHRKDCDRLAKKIMAEILKEEKEEKKQLLKQES